MRLCLQVDTTIERMKSSLREVGRVADIMQDRWGFKQGSIITNSCGKGDVVGHGTSDMDRRSRRC